MAWRDTGVRARALIERTRRVASLAASDGPRAVARRVLTQAMGQLGPVTEVPVDIDDLLRPLANLEPLALQPLSGRLRVGWVMTPPSAGSGGHTTIFRLVQALEQRGHTCTIYLSQPRGAGDLRVHRHVIGGHFPSVDAEVRDARDGFGKCDVLMATAWPSAYVVRKAASRAHRVYLIQDYEPWFHPAGGQAALAEATYRFGFHGITAGRWLADKLSREFGMSCTPFEFGIDPRYSLIEPSEAHRDVLFYARPSTPRRAFELGVLALTEMARKHPEIRIHLVGERIRRPLPFRYVDHGVLSVPQLNLLQNRCRVGLVLSMSNLSLLPLELLASGCIPVVNDAPYTRGVVANEWIRWVQPEPFALAEAMSELLAEPIGEIPARAAASVRDREWGHAGETVEAALLRIVQGQKEGLEVEAAV